jgi:hypothetical protein
MREGLFLVSLISSASRPYVKGDRYWIHPIQGGILPKFLNCPENKKKGIRKIDVAAETALASLMTLPNSNPNEFPHSDIRKDMK